MLNYLGLKYKGFNISCIILNEAQNRTWMGVVTMHQIGIAVIWFNNISKQHWIYSYGDWENNNSCTSFYVNNFVLAMQLTSYAKQGKNNKFALFA